MEGISDRIVVAYAFIIEHSRLQKKFILSNTLLIELKAYIKNKGPNTWNLEVMLLKALMGAQLLESLLGESPRDITEMNRAEWEKFIEDTADKILVHKLRSQTQTGN